MVKGFFLSLLHVLLCPSYAGSSFLTVCVSLVQDCIYYMLLYSQIFFF